MKIGCHTLQWGMAIDREQRYTWDGRIWKVSLEEVLDDISKLRFEGFECTDGDLTPYLHDPKEFRRIVSSSGLEFVSSWNTLLPKKMDNSQLQTVNPNLPMSDPGQYAPISIDKITKEDVKEDLREKVSFAEKLVAMGGSMITVGGPYMLRENIREEYYAMAGNLLNEIGERVKKSGVKIAYHPELGTLVQKISDIDALFDYADKKLIGLCLETAHLTAAGEDAVKFVDKYSSRIIHAHMKDLNDEGQFVELGEGMVNFREIIRHLRETGYDGWLMAELDIPRKTAHEAAGSNKKYLDNILGQLGR